MAGLAQGGRGCEEKRDKSERAGHAGIRDTRGLLPLLCPGGRGNGPVQGVWTQQCPIEWSARVLVGGQCW